MNGETGLYLQLLRFSFDMISLLICFGYLFHKRNDDLIGSFVVHVVGIGLGVGVGGKGV